MPVSQILTQKKNICGQFCFKVLFDPVGCYDGLDH